MTVNSLIKPSGLEWPLLLKGGYYWIDRPRDSYLVGHMPLDEKTAEPRPPRAYFPANNPKLFIRFAYLEPTKEAVIAFAETFGDLGLECPIPDTERYDPEMGIPIHGDPLSVWLTEAHFLRQAYALWRALRQGAGDPISQEYLSDKAIRMEQEEGYYAADRHIAARQIIASILNERLDKYRATGFIELDSAGAGLELSFQPENLIGLIWLQFAQLVTAGYRWQACEYCGEPFRVESKRARYCSESHRQMAYRKRKEANQ